MELSALQILYAIIFLAIILLVEGAYLFYRGSDAKEYAANRRMKAMADKEAVSVAPSILRKQILGGPVSRFLIKQVPDLQRAFWVANIGLTPGRALAYCGIIFLAISVILTAIPAITLLPAIAIAAFVAFGLPWLVLMGIVSSERKKFNEQLPDAINLITRGLQAGHPVSVAFGLVAREMPDPIGTQFGNAIDEINYGRDRTEALREIAKRFPNPEFRFFVATIEMQRESGGNLVGILDNLTKVIRERANLKKKAMAISAEGRLTAIIVGSLPYLLGVFLLVTNPSLILGAAEHAMFFPLMFGAWCLWLVGIIMIWRMVNIKV